MTDEIKWDGKYADAYISGSTIRVYPLTQAQPPILLNEEAWAFLTAEVTRRQGHEARRLEDTRDAFAAAALTGMLAATNGAFGYTNIAETAWEIADAVMEEKK